MISYLSKTETAKGIFLLKATWVIFLLNATWVESFSLILSQYLYLFFIFRVLLLYEFMFFFLVHLHVPAVMGQFSHFILWLTPSLPCSINSGIESLDDCNWSTNSTGQPQCFFFFFKCFHPYRHCFWNYTFNVKRTILLQCLPTASVGRIWSKCTPSSHPLHQLVMAHNTLKRI